MKTLTELCMDDALRRAAEPGVNPEELFSLELAFTDAFRANRAAPIEKRELACLRVLFPALLQPVQPDDLFAGRIRYPFAGFSPECGGLGYYCREAEIERLLSTAAVPASQRRRVDDMLAFWRSENTASKVRAACPDWVNATLPSDAWMEDSGMAFPLYRLGGTQLDYGLLVRDGIPGLRARVDAKLGASPDPAVRGLGSAMLGALDLLGGCCGHYAAQARRQAADAHPEDAFRLLEIAATLEALTRRAPASLREAMQLMWLYALVSGTWNYGRMDVYFGPFLQRDLESGRLTENQALELIQSLWRLMKGYDNCFNNRVIIGGRGRPDEAASDEFARLAIEATRRNRLDQPQLSLRFYEGQNPALMQAALAAIGEGCTFPILYNDDVNVPAVAKSFNVPESESVHYTPFGCGEYVLEHRSVGTPSGVINLLKCLEVALHNGFDPVAGRIAGPATGDPAAWTSFESVWTAYQTQVATCVEALALQEKIEYDVAGKTAPFLFLSLLYDDCLERGRALFDGGARHLGGTLETYGNTNAADSLAAIREVVFDQKTFSLAEVVSACDRNFKDSPELRQRLADAPKYGNDDDGADAMARRVHEQVCAAARDSAKAVGLDSYLVVIINNWANVVLGRKTAASADGREAGGAMANANNPAPGADRNGLTAFLNSLVKLSPELHAGAVQNIKLAPSLFRQDLPKLESVLRAYWRQGGAQAMITVVNADDLAAAMREPEKWGSLMVRVGGFSARFVDLPRDAQLEILNRTLHG
ncbi:MAG: pyruvate formate lyase family protein [Verrucomicrobiota bacterium]